MSYHTWSEWLREGHFYSFEDQQHVRSYFMALVKEYAHYVYRWEEDVFHGAESGPFNIIDLETTKENQIWQIIFGIKPDAYIYVYLPTDTIRHGIAKRSAASAGFREVGAFTMQDSPFYRPSFLTEHFLIKPHTPYISLKAYNPTNIDFEHDFNPITINFVINKVEMENIGTEANGELAPADPRYSETLDKLYRRVIPHKPLSLWPIRAPAKGV